VRSEWQDRGEHIVAACAPGLGAGDRKGRQARENARGLFLRINPTRFASRR